jgi:hypothetical protein
MPANRIALNMLNGNAPRPGFCTLAGDQVVVGIVLPVQSSEDLPENPG